MLAIDLSFLLGSFKLNWSDKLSLNEKISLSIKRKTLIIMGRIYIVNTRLWSFKFKNFTMLETFKFKNSTMLKTPLCWRRQWHPILVLLPGKSHGWRSLVGCSPWGSEESDMAEWLHFHFSLLCTGEGNGNPLQCSCLENPRDGVAQSRTRLKWLSSSSMLEIVKSY